MTILKFPTKIRCMADEEVDKILVQNFKDVLYVNIFANLSPKYRSLVLCVFQLNWCLLKSKFVILDKIFLIKDAKFFAKVPPIYWEDISLSFLAQIVGSANQKWASRQFFRLFPRAKIIFHVSTFSRFLHRRFFWFSTSVFYPFLRLNCIFNDLSVEFFINSAFLTYMGKIIVHGHFWREYSVAKPLFECSNFWFYMYVQKTLNLISWGRISWGTISWGRIFWKKGAANFLKPRS